MNTLENIPYSEITRDYSTYSKLFLDYIQDFSRVKSYFDTDFRILRKAEHDFKCVKYDNSNRGLLADVLREQNSIFNLSQATLSNIDLIRNENTFAVVTGQQVGIFGGPLYTIYKTITALHLTDFLRQTYPDYNFVPVFWLEGEDHDLAEVNNIKILSPDHRMTQIELPVLEKQKNTGPVGEIQLNGSIVQFLEIFRKHLANNEYKPPLMELLERSYSAGTTFNTAFASFINQLFPEKGLVFISSNDIRLKKILSPIFLRELREYPHTSQLIIKQSAELEGKYHAQIKPKAVNLFFLTKGGRYLIEPRESDFSLRGTRQFISREEMLSNAENHPEYFSPNVALRPICQDTLLPTAAYVAGPSEIAYYAQLKNVYHYFGLNMPVIYPRSSVTLIEDKHLRIMEKYQISLIDLFKNPDSLSGRVIDNLSEVKVSDLFTEAEHRINDLCNELSFGLSYIDPTLSGTLENTKQKFHHHLSLLKDRAGEAHTRRHEVATRQIDKVLNHMKPNGNFQEREFNITYFMGKHGNDFAEKLFNAISPEHLMHQIIQI